MTNSLINHIDIKNLPQHIAIIMDGNGRWAKSKGMPRIYGHTHGVKAVKEVTEAATEIGIKYLTLYAFSTENWNRPSLEVNALMHLLVDTIKKEVSSLNDNNIKLNTIGDLSKFPPRNQKALMEAMEKTKNNDRMTLTLALNYSSKWEIVDSVKKIAAKVKNGSMNIDDINEEVFSNHLSTAGIPDPELLIRTSGEKRISNYLLWQLAYTELHFLDIYWPDFRKNHLFESILDYQKRERRFGKISDQIS